ncbi:MAG TPA: tetratricopeptide repeat protein [Candidatus Udaeobacter sp.]|nr:tetratricopeptide repeat protein [Candidatus Udaeobacter sp.]
MTRSTRRSRRQERTTRDRPKQPRNTSGVFGGRAAVIAGAVVALLLYLPSLQFQFVRDDHDLIEHNPVLSSGPVRILTSDFWTTLQTHSGLWRPATTLSYAVDFKVAHDTPAWYHAVNLTLHAAVTALLILLMIQFGVAALPALVAGVWFAAMPAHVESVAWISGRTDLLSAAFCLATLWLDQRRRARGASNPGMLAPAMLVLALLSKEVAAGLIIVLAAVAWIDPRNASKSAGDALRDMARWLAPYLAVTAVYVTAHQLVVGAAATRGYIDAATRSHARLAALTIPAHLIAFLWPGYPHSPEIALPLPGSWASGMVVIGSLILIAMLGAIVMLTRRRSALLPPVTLFAAGIAPTLLTVWLQSYFAFGERLTYLPSAGIAWALALALGRVGSAGSSRAWSAAFAALAVASAVVTHSILPAWRDDATLFDAIAATQPMNPTGHIGRAEQLAGQGRRDEALAELNRAEAINPRLPEIPLARARIAYRARDWSAVLEGTARALTLEPANDDALLLRAGALVRMRRLDEARPLFDRLRRDRPQDPLVASEWGQYLFLSGRAADAVPFLETAAQANPDDPEIQFALGQAGLASGDPKVASEAFRRVVAADPGDAFAWLRLAVALDQLGDHTGAESARQRSAALRGSTPTPGGGGEPPR